MNGSMSILKPLTIGELGKRTGVATSKVWFYEERGLIHAERNGSGHGRYERSVARRAVNTFVWARREWAMKSGITARTGTGA